MTISALWKHLSSSLTERDVPSTAERNLSSPAERSRAGEGDSPEGGGGGISLEINSLITLTCAAPSTTLGVVPIPRFAGKERLALLVSLARVNLPPVTTCRYRCAP